MDLDQLPDLSRARLVRARARGVAIRDGERAVAVAFVADGTLLPPDTLVRFDVTHGEDAARRLDEAFASTSARGIWFYGGDAVTRRAVAELELDVRPAGAAFVHRMDPSRRERVVFRPPSARDGEVVAELQREHAEAFRAPQTEVAEVHGEPVGIVVREPLDRDWTEVCAAVFPERCGKGYGAALLGALAERVESAGRRVCAATATLTGPERTALETAGFRLSDYYFIATKR
jgi:GNAT superfamily N-acetyltransferase